MFPSANGFGVDPPGKLATVALSRKSTNQATALLPGNRGQTARFPETSVPNSDGNSQTGRVREGAGDWKPFPPPPD